MNQQLINKQYIDLIDLKKSYHPRMCRIILNDCIADRVALQGKSSRVTSDSQASF